MRSRSCRASSNARLRRAISKGTSASDTAWRTVPGKPHLRRGLGFALWSADPEASSNPFSPRAFGHTGFTGTCLWVDPERDLVVAFLTNEVYHGREGRGIGPLRVTLHRLIVQEVDMSLRRTAGDENNGLSAA